MSRSTANSDVDYVTGAEREEIEDAKAWHAVRNHTQQWITATHETWELDPFAGRWFLVEPENLREATPRLTMDEFDAYKDTCEAQAAFAGDLGLSWRKVDAEVHDRDSIAERKYLDDLGWEMVVHPEDWI